MHPTFRILVIEDDADTRANLRDILELDGHEVFLVASFEDSILVTQAHEIGMVIADRRLPDGLIEEFLPKLKATSPNSEIIVVTGYGDMQSTIAALRLGVTDYVIKPIIPDDIRAIVNRIAEKQSLRADLVDAQSRAIQAERLAAIGQTMTALAHESRNVLQRIRAASDVLSLEIAGNPDAEESLEMIQRASSDLQRLLEEIRSFAAPIQLHRNRVHLPSVWQRAWADIAPSRDRRNAELAETLNGCELDVEIDTVRMEQVFRNLFENSLAAGVDPVRIHVDCRCTEGVVEVRCGDNGPGLNEEQQKRVFEPFYTTKNSGTGLGMPICERIIEAHSGTIQVEPSDSGACFLIRLPHRTRLETQLPLETPAMDCRPISAAD